MQVIEFISQPWPWYISGPLITLVMILLVYFGRSFGFSSNFRTACAAMGAGRKVTFFDYNWKDHIWNLLFALGALIGGFIASNFLSNGDVIQISQATMQDLKKIGLEEPRGLNPHEIFNWEYLLTLRGLFIILGGGFLIGFGTRYAGGCTSGHAISGLSDLQMPSLIAVIGFFIGGLVMTHLLFPLIF